MSTWKLIESRLNDSLVPVYLTSQEYAIVQEAMSSVIRARLNEGSAWQVFEELSEAVTFSIPVKGLTQQQTDILKKKFPELEKQFKTGNSGTLLMVEPAVWQNIKKQITSDRSLRGLEATEDLLTKIDGALELIQGKAATDRERSVAPDFGKPGMTPTVAKPTGLNDPSQSATVPRYNPGSPSSASGGSVGSTLREPDQERELDPLEFDLDALHKAHGTTPTAKSKVKAQDVASMKGSGAAKTTVLDPSQQKKTDDMEDPRSWAEGIKLFNKLMQEAK